MDGGAYGAGKATGKFDVVAFIKKPQVILRLVSLLFSIIVFGCISSQGWEKESCRYNGDGNACGFGTIIGVFSFLGLIALLGVDFYFENISSVQHRKYAVIADLAFSGLWTFFWFVNFCYLADAWRRSEDVKSEWGDSGVEAAIVFSFFSIATFAGITALAFLTFKKGVGEQFTAGYDPDVLGPRTTADPSYPQYPVPVQQGQGSNPFQRTDQYVQPPFAEQKMPGDFQQVSY